MIDLDRWVNHVFENVEEMGGHAIWGQAERPADPTGWRVRKLLEMLSDNHRKVLEDTFFLRIPIAEQARERGVSRQAVQNLLERATKGFAKTMAEHGQELLEVPKDEL